MCCICNGGRNGTDNEPLVLPLLDQTGLDEWVQSQEPTNYFTPVSDDCYLDIKTSYYENPNYQDAKILFGATTCETKSVRVTLYLSEADAELILETSVGDGPYAFTNLEDTFHPMGNGIR